MQWPKLAAVVAGVAAIGLVAGFLIYRGATDRSGRAFDESFLENCLESARQAAARQGSADPEVDAIIQRRCRCALDVVKPLPEADKIALGNSEEKQREIMAEVRKRCP